ncbi:hypothetical protein FGU65_07195 [Methanoculleus sp. FWC-SCC1]|uniref:Uncharacterized protein n=2 Tax=Methanoculleus frigidifontis TaxID=2584085 RepID=A0ABT8M9R9_9EURY|nr:hypothetical protein [Methanoculleus sp. FWC-SCC1]
MMTIDSVMIIILSLIIISLLFIMYVMYVRIKQLLAEVEGLTSRMEVTGSEVEQLTRSMEEYKMMKI